MPSVKLTEYECRNDLLPNVCMFCGRPAVTRTQRRFSWHPEWVWILILVSLLIAAILAVVLTKRMRVRVPVCEEHEGFWKRRSASLVISFFAIAVVSVGGFIVAADLGGRNDDVSGWVCGGGVILLLFWLVAAAIWTSRGPRPTEITDRYIRLRGINEEFIYALQDDRERDREEEEEYRRTKRAERMARERQPSPPPSKSNAIEDDLERRARG